MSMSYLTIQVIEKNRTISTDNSGHGLVGLHGFVVLCLKYSCINLIMPDELPLDVFYGDFM